MTLAGILISAYLIIGLVATVIIWAALRASKRRESQARNAELDNMRASPFRERKTRPSRSH